MYMKMVLSVSPKRSRRSSIAATASSTASIDSRCRRTEVSNAIRRSMSLTAKKRNHGGLVDISAPQLGGRHGGSEAKANSWRGAGALGPCGANGANIKKKGRLALFRTKFSARLAMTSVE